MKRKDEAKLVKGVTGRGKIEKEYKKGKIKRGIEGKGGRENGNEDKGKRKE